MLKDILKRPVVFYPALARLFGGINEALMWQQIFYWSDKGSREDGWIYKTKDELQEETTLTRDQQDRARAKLEALGVLETKVMKVNGAPTLHYRVDADKVLELLSDNSDKRKTSDSLKSGKPANPLYTESTTDTLSSNELEETETEEDDVVIEVDEELKPNRPLSRKKDTSYRQVYQLWSKYYGGSYPSWWNVNPHIKGAAERLLAEKGLAKCKRAVDFWLAHRSDQFCPQLSTPKDLEEKWQKALEYKNNDR